MIKACQEQWRRRRRRQQPSPASALLSTRPAAALQVPPLLPLLLLLLAPCQRALAQEALCQPGLIKLEEPRGPPARVQLPFCKEFGCSCCASRHALSIARAFSRTTDGGDTSDACVAALRLLACRPCDPEVGAAVLFAVCHPVSNCFVKSLIARRTQGHIARCACKPACAPLKRDRRSASAQNQQFVCKPATPRLTPAERCGAACCPHGGAGAAALPPHCQQPPCMLHTPPSTRERGAQGLWRLPHSTAW
jgi:hypothetical protein